MSEFPPPPPGPESSTPQNQFGLPGYPSGPPQYGQNPYPATPQYGDNYGQQPTKRPGVVTAAAVITIVLTALSALGGVALAIVGFAMDAEDLGEEFIRELNNSDITPDQYPAVMTAVGVVGVVWIFMCIIPIILSVFLLKGSNGARITLTVFAALTALMSLVSILSGFSAVWLIGAVLVIVFLFTKQANAWFASKRATPNPAYYG